MNNLAFILLLVSISLESGVVYYISSGKLDALQMARFCVLWTIAAGSIAASVWWLGLRFTGTSFFGNADFLGASLLFIGGILLTTFFNALFYSKHQFGFPNKILVVVNICLIILLISGNGSEWVRDHFLLLYFFSYALQGILLMTVFFIWHPEKGERGIPSSPVLKMVIRYSLTALTANIIYFLVSRIDYWLVAHYCSASDLGNYIQATKLGQMLLIVPSILGSTLFPLLSSGKRANADADLQCVVRVLLWINLCICVMLICFGSYVLPLIFGKSFDKMYMLFVLLIPGILAFTANFPIAAWFSARDRIWVNISGAVLSLLLILAGDMLILPYAGVRAASCVSSAGYFCYYCYMQIIYRKENPSSLKDFLFIRKDDVKWIYQLIKNKISWVFPEKPIAP
ncbi:MAG: oligosaccharide flippase family protein, partial [Bacteroidota bacterium]|nr:oligosaccharide flippase family protein [Bacteroidota bacterium]